MAEAKDAHLISNDQVSDIAEIHVDHFSSCSFAGLYNHFSYSDDEGETNETSKLNRQSEGSSANITKQVDQANHDGKLNFSPLGWHSESSSNDIADNINKTLRPIMMTK